MGQKCDQMNPITLALHTASRFYGRKAMEAWENSQSHGDQEFAMAVRGDQIKRRESSDQSRMWDVIATNYRTLQSRAQGMMK